MLEWQKDAVQRQEQQEKEIEDLLKQNDILKIMSDDAEERKRAAVDEASKLTQKLNAAEEKNKMLLASIGSASGALFDAKAEEAKARAATAIKDAEANWISRDASGLRRKDELIETLRAELKEMS